MLFTSSKFKIFWFQLEIDNNYKDIIQNQSNTKPIIVVNKINIFVIQSLFVAFVCIYLSTKIQKQPFADVHKIGVPKNFAIFTGKHLCWSFFLIKRLY